MAEEELKTFCVLEESDACEGEDDDGVALVQRIGFTQCVNDNQSSLDKLMISDADIESGGEEIPDDTEEGETVKVPLTKTYTVPAKETRTVEISVTGEKRGAFSATAWMNDLFITFTRVNTTNETYPTYDEYTSQLSNDKTWYWNREAKDGDLAGRVPVNVGDKYYM